MSEAVKTAIFCVAALVAVALAVATRPTTTKPEDIDPLGKALYPDFTDPSEARELKILRFDEKQGELSEFEISQKDGRWVIPSHSDYPADAENQLKEAATCLIDLTVVDRVSTNPEAHKEFGVIEPDKEKLKAGEEGVGVLVSMKGADGSDLAKLIISEKKVQDNPDKRFVRKSGEDWTYVVKIDPTKLSTKFSDWIEKDLLKLNAFDVDHVVLKDYSVTMVMAEQVAVSLNQRFELTASQEPSGSPSWKLDKLLTYRNGEEVRTVLSDSEELNTQKLDDLKSALDNLEIVDVRHKPKGLTASLKADEGLFKDREGIQSLAALGFLPLRSAKGPPEIYAANGEVVVGMKEGYQYVLRFGNVEGAQDADANKLNRYLLVTTQVNEAKFPEPVLEPLPDLPADEPAGPAKPEVKKEPEPKKDDAKDEGEEEEEPKKDEVKKDEEKKVDEKKVDEKKEPEPTPEDAKKAAERKRAEIKATRDRIDKENKRKLDDHKANRKKAEEKVRELNSRFADWYYVISEDVYKKVHLSRVDLIKEKTATLDEGFGVDAFRKLEEGGLKKDPPKAPPGGFNPPSGLPPGLPGLPPG